MSSSCARESRPRDLKDRWNMLFLGAVMVWGLIGFGVLCMQPKQSTFLSRAMTVMEMVGDQDTVDEDAVSERDELISASDSVGFDFK